LHYKHEPRDIVDFIALDHCKNTQVIWEMIDSVLDNDFNGADKNTNLRDIIYAIKSGALLFLPAKNRFVIRSVDDAMRYASQYPNVIKHQLASLFPENPLVIVQSIWNNDYRFGVDLPILTLNKMRSRGLGRTNEIEHGDLKAMDWFRYSVDRTLFCKVFRSGSDVMNHFMSQMSGLSLVSKWNPVNPDDWRNPRLDVNTQWVIFNNGVKKYDLRADFVIRMGFRSIVQVEKNYARSEGSELDRFLIYLQLKMADVSNQHAAFVNHMVRKTTNLQKDLSFVVRIEDQVFRITKNLEPRKFNWYLKCSYFTHDVEFSLDAWYKRDQNGTSIQVDRNTDYVKLLEDLASRGKIKLKRLFTIPGTRLFVHNESRMNTEGLVPGVNFKFIFFYSGQKTEYHRNLFYILSFICGRDNIDYCVLRDSDNREIDELKRTLIGNFLNARNIDNDLAHNHVVEMDFPDNLGVNTVLTQCDIFAGYDREKCTIICNETQNVMVVLPWRNPGGTMATIDQVVEFASNGQAAIKSMGIPVVSDSDLKERERLSLEFMQGVGNCHSEGEDAPTTKLIGHFRNTVPELKKKIREMPDLWTKCLRLFSHWQLFEIISYDQSQTQEFMAVDNVPEYFEFLEKHKFKTAIVWTSTADVMPYSARVETAEWYTVLPVSCTVNLVADLFCKKTGYENYLMPIYVGQPKNKTHRHNFLNIDPGQSDTLPKTTCCIVCVMDSTLDLFKLFVFGILVQKQKKRTVTADALDILFVSLYDYCRCCKVEPNSFVAIWFPFECFEVLQSLFTDDVCKTHDLTMKLLFSACVLFVPATRLNAFYEQHGIDRGYRDDLHGSLMVTKRSPSGFVHVKVGGKTHQVNLDREIGWPNT
jgi:hypothetical protein